MTFNKLLQHFEKNCFLTVKRNSNQVHGFQYGPFGAYLKDHVFNEWRNSVLNSNEVTVFPVSSQTAIDCSTKMTSENVHQRVTNLEHHYPSAMKLMNNHYPFGLASWKCWPTSETCKANEKLNTEAFSSSLCDLCNPLNWTSLTQVYFCSQKQSVYWFDRLHRLRIHWWKSLSRMPASYSFIEVPQNNSSVSQVDIVFSFMGQTFPVESIFNIGAVNMNFGMNVPHVIISEASLDCSVLTFLLDGYQEKEKGMVMRLNYKLVPYKVALLYRNTNVTDYKELLYLAEYISKQLSKVKVTVFPNRSIGTAVTVEEQFNWLDELGIPYVIVLESQTLYTGIVTVRNRDTTLEEQVHLVDVKVTLARYV